MWRKENFTGCQNYIKDNHGRHTGCRFQNVTIENKRAHFLVNGSKSGQNIQTYEKMIFLYEIGKLACFLLLFLSCFVLVWFFFALLFYFQNSSLEKAYILKILLLRTDVFFPPFHQPWWLKSQKYTNEQKRMQRPSEIIGQRIMNISVQYLFSVRKVSYFRIN